MVAPLQAQQSDSTLLSVQRIYATPEFRSQGFGPARWLGDGSSYTTLEDAGSGGGQNLVRYDTERGGRQVLLAARQFIPQGDSVARQPDAADLHQHQTGVAAQHAGRLLGARARHR
jgi:hypothetical protein